MSFRAEFRALYFDKKYFEHRDNREILKNIERAVLHTPLVSCMTKEQYKYGYTFCVI